MPPIILSILSSMAAARLYSHLSGWAALELHSPSTFGWVCKMWKVCISMGNSAEFGRK